VQLNVQRSRRRFSQPFILWWSMQSIDTYGVPIHVPPVCGVLYSISRAA